MIIEVKVETRRTKGETAGDVSDKIDLFKKIGKQFGWDLTDVELHAFGWGHKGTLTFDVSTQDEESSK